jgi:hypothetical protein
MCSPCIYIKNDKDGSAEKGKQKNQKTTILKGINS